MQHLRHVGEEVREEERAKKVEAVGHNPVAHGFPQRHLATQQRGGDVHDVTGEELTTSDDDQHEAQRENDTAQKLLNARIVDADRGRTTSNE